MIEINIYTVKDYFRDKNISLKEQKELTFLSCRNNKLTSLKGIENCIKLTYLKCDDTEVIEQYDNENIKINIFFILKIMLIFSLCT
jgi:Leucine-rich repeat (LRR) protein